MKHSEQNQSHIRFTDEEYTQILEDAEIYNETIPNLLKAVYFRRHLPRPVMYPDDARRALAELSRMGNNVNQIARHLNSGFREGFNPSVEKMATAIEAMKNYIMSGHGHSQN